MINYTARYMKYINNVNNIFIFLILFLGSILISYTYYFDHLALVNTSVIYNDEIYDDEKNLFYLIQSNSPSFLFVIINVLSKIGFSTNFLNLLLTFLPTLFYMSGIYLISKFITSSKFLSILISMTAIILTKNLGDIDYPVLMFSWHTVGLFAYSLSTLIFGFLTLRNLFFAFFTSLILLSIHLTVGLWMFGIISLSSFFLINKKNIKKIGYTVFILIIVILFYLYWFSYFAADIPFKFNQEDYDNYFYNLEAHRVNYGDLSNLYLDYVLKSFFLITLIFLYLKFSFSNTENNNNFFLKTLTISIFFSGIIYFVYKIFPHIFPEIAIRTIPQRFFLIHSVVGYPLMISIFYKLLKNFLIFKKINKNFSFNFIAMILILHLFQHNDVIIKRFNNIKIINNDKAKENLFWSKVNNIKTKNYILTSNNLCNKTVLYSNFPILFCFDALDIIPLLPNLASPIRKMTDKVLGVSYLDLKDKNLGGISENELKKIYENKNSYDWNILKRDLNVGIIIVPLDWNLDLDLIIEDKYRVYKIK